jgi:hypothetical protein
MSSTHGTKTPESTTSKPISVTPTPAATADVMSTRAIDPVVAIARSSSSSSMSEAAKEFLLAEHARLREQILHHRKQVDGDDSIALAGSGAFWAWMLTHGDWQARYPWAWAIPVCFTAFFALRWISHARAMASIGGYLRRIEEAFQLPGQLGWETFLVKRRSQWINTAKVLFYAALIAAHILIGRSLVPLSPSLVPPPSAIRAKS